ncbi:MAG: Oxygen-independent coproporphyrinogen III oxidase, partial [uncultured bacterium]
MHVYVHIPFCLKKCAYCDFASTGLDAFSGRPPLDEYFRALTAEIESRAPLMDDTSVSTIYF